MAMSFTSPLGKTIGTLPANSGNQITKSYYDFLVGEINRGTVIKAVCAIEHRRFNYTSYHLISIR